MKWFVPDAALNGAGFIAQSAVAAIATNIPANVNALYTCGYNSAGDGGSSLYYKVGANPSPAFGFQTADGAWWKIAPVNGYINLMGCGADNTGVASVVSALVKTANSFGSAGGIIAVPPGHYKIDSTVTIPDYPISIEGANPGNTFFDMSITNVDGIVMTSTAPYSCSGFTMNATGGTVTAGAFLKCDPGAGNTVFAVKVEWINTNNHYTGIDMVRCSDFAIDKIEGVNASGSLASIRVRNITNGDLGDSSITRCYLAGAGGDGILQNSSGGVRLVNNKFNGAANGYHMDIQSTTATSILLANSNSFESQTANSMKFERTSGTSTFSYAMISDNEFAYTPKGVNIATAGAFDNFTIKDNLFALFDTQYGIYDDGCVDAVYDNNHVKGLDGPGNCYGIRLTANSLRPRIGRMTYQNVYGPQVISNSSTTAISFYNSWSTSDSVTVSTASGSFFYTDKAITFPTGLFAQGANVAPAVLSPGAFAVVVAGSLTTSGCTIRVYGFTNGAVIPFTVTATGI